MFVTLGWLLLAMALVLIVIGRGKSGRGATFLGDGLLSLLFPVLVIILLVAGIGLLSGEFDAPIPAS